MAWFKIDDTLHSHPKVRQAGPNSVGIWAMAGSYSSAYKTNGFVPLWWVRELGRAGTKAARKLVEVGLWDQVDGDEPGYQFHDWDDYQPSSDEIERDRELARERQRRSRERRSRHAAGDHSLCDRCQALVSQNTRDSHGNVTRDNERDSRVSHGTPSRPDPSRPDPSRPDKGQGRGKAQGRRPGPEGAQASTAGGALTAEQIHLGWTEGGNTSLPEAWQ